MFGVNTKFVHVLPDYIKHDKATRKAIIITEIGTIKYGVLTGDTECLNLVADFVYDTKTIHFFPLPIEDMLGYKIMGGRG